MDGKICGSQGIWGDAREVAGGVQGIGRFFEYNITMLRSDENVILYQW